jgi:hypothetical protein
MEELLRHPAEGTEQAKVKEQTLKGYMLPSETTNAPAPVNQPVNPFRRITMLFTKPRNRCAP